MPQAAPKPCNHPNCSVLVQRGDRYCDQHRKAKQQHDDSRRGTSSERGYTGAWQRARAAYLRVHPLCRRCERDGVLKAASVVDHIVPHRGDDTLFWDSDGNWQPLCKRCHDIKTAKEDGGFGR
jgi:5-methylcytosine-specific restriction protein A